MDEERENSMKRGIIFTLSAMEMEGERGRKKHTWRWKR